MVCLFCRFFGCGLPFPAKLEGCRVLDLGSGSGRDCFAFSKLVGPGGHVTGIDMTEEMVRTPARTHTHTQSCTLADPMSLQITAARQFIPYHQEKFGYDEPNVTFVQGFMEKLSEAGIQPESMDVLL